MIFDTHAHYLSNQFRQDRDKLLSELPAKGVCGVVECAVDYATSVKSIQLAEKYQYIYSAVGIHPESLIDKEASTVYKYKGDWQAELADIEKLINHPKCVAIGECGLDYHWPVPKDEQNVMLRSHLELAKKYDKPIIVHDREAHADCYALLNEYKPHGVLHCYSGSAQDAARMAQSGMYFGFGGVSTFKNAKKTLEAIASLPLDKILLETDCPYMAPEPFRGKRCDSSMIAYTAKAAAEAKGITEQELLSAAKQNALRFFKI